MKVKNNCKKCGALKSKFSQCKCSRGYVPTTDYVEPTKARTYPPCLYAFGEPIPRTEMWPNESNSPIITN